MLVAAIFVVGLLVTAEWLYVTLSGDYLDSGAKGPAWGFLQGLWIGLIVLWIVLVVTYFIRLLSRRRAQPRERDRLPVGDRPKVNAGTGRAWDVGSANWVAGKRKRQGGGIGRNVRRR